MLFILIENASVYIYYVIKYSFRFLTEREKRGQEIGNRT